MSLSYPVPPIPNDNQRQSTHVCCQIFWAHTGEYVYRLFSPFEIIILYIIIIINVDRIIGSDACLPLYPNQMTYMSKFTPCHQFI